jgi:putative tricarboxylic transport membrane protein
MTIPTEPGRHDHGSQSGGRVPVQWGHVALVVAVLGFTLWFLHDTWTASRRPQNLMLVLPVAMLSVVVGIAIIGGMILRWRRNLADGPLPAIDLRIPGLMLLVGAYVAGLLVTGFDLATFLFMASCLWLLGERNHLLVIGYSAAVTVVAVYGLREIVSLPLPTLLFHR